MPPGLVPGEVDLAGEVREEREINVVWNQRFTARDVTVGLRCYAVVFFLIVLVANLDMGGSATVTLFSQRIPKGVPTLLAILVGVYGVLHLAGPAWALKRRIARAEDAASWTIRFSEDGVRGRCGSVMTLEFSWELLHCVRCDRGEFLRLYFGDHFLGVPLCQLNEPMHALLVKAINEHDVALAGDTSWLAVGNTCRGVGLVG